MGRGAVVRRFLPLAIALAFGACGSQGETETSVHLVVNNGPNMSLPVEVEINIFEGSSQLVRDNITRSVPAGSVTRLGDVVVYPAPGTASLRFVVIGRKDGQSVSTSEATAAVKPGQQVEVVATLRASAPMLPVEFCKKNPDGTKCGDAICSSNKRTLSLFTCKAGNCVQQDQSCPQKQCTATPPACL
jgi:hypothetical protein